MFSLAKTRQREVIRIFAADKKSCFFTDNHWFEGLAMKGMVLSTDACGDLAILKNEIPKALVSVCNRPVMDWMFRLLKAHDIEELMVSLHHYPEEVRKYFDYGSSWGLCVWYSQEPMSAGNAGSLKRVEGFFGNRSLIMLTGGILCDIDIKKLIDFHKKNQALVTLGLVKTENTSKVKIYLDQDNVTVARVQDDHVSHTKGQGYATCGVYVLEPRVFEHIPKNRFFDLREDLLPLLLKNNEKVCGFKHDGYWLDINTLDDFRKANFDILREKVKVAIPWARASSKDGIWVGEGTDIHESVHIRPPVSIGSDCSIGEGVALIGPCVVGDNTIIDKDVTFQRSIVWGRGYVGKNSRINGALIGDSTYISSNVEIGSNAIIGVNCIIGPHSTIHEGTVLNPGTAVEKNSYVDLPAVKVKIGRNKRRLL